ncbi:MAG: caspase family protein [Anaerolineae bacterium]|nr:caspase family protein [Anaerolineae bacterium]
MVDLVEDQLENADGSTRAVLVNPSGGYPVDALQQQFEHSLAVIIGINAYKFPQKVRMLHTARPDAAQLAALLQDDRRDPLDRYEMVPMPLYDEQATGDALRTLLEKTLPARVRECGPKTRVLFYFAGHGDADASTRKSFLFPQDADPDDEGTLLRMDFVQQALADLPCQHVLIILDCCSAGALPTATAEAVRGRGGRPTRVYWEYLNRFVGARTRQVITSAGARQQAADRSSFGRYQLGQREGDDQEHSPFAQALFEALDPDNHPNTWGRPPGRDGVVTATELYLHVAEALAQGRARQTPGIWTLIGKGHDQGEYIFLLPGAQVTLEPEPDLSDPKNNPWPGLRPYRAEYDYLFAGRDQEIGELAQRVASHPWSP